MKVWLDNVTDEKIEGFIRKKVLCDTVKVNRKDDFIDIMAIVNLEGPESVDVREYRMAYNSYGSGLLYKGEFMLGEYDENASLWFELVNDCNKGIVVNGLTYLEAFEQAHEKAIIRKQKLSNALIEGKIEKLKKMQLENQVMTETKLGNLHKHINSVRQTETSQNINLIVKDFLMQMSKAERDEWLINNGFKKAKNQSSEQRVVSGVLFN